MLCSFIANHYESSKSNKERLSIDSYNKFCWYLININEGIKQYK